MVFEDQNLSFDSRVFSILESYTTPARTKFVSFITFFGGADFLLPANIALILIFAFNKKIRFHAWKILVVSVTGTIVLFSLKAILERERPIVPLISKAHGYSFPSGHSFSACLFFGMVAYFVYKTGLNKWVKWAIILTLILLVLAIGFSRVYLKVHYATDVIAGWLLGLMWLLLAKWLLINRRRKLPIENAKPL